MATREQKIVVKGWDRPLVVDWNFQTGLLRREIKNAAPGRGGDLARAFDSPDTAVINEDENIITVKVGRQHKAWPYAKIQNFGGYIPPFNIRTQGKPGHKPVMVAYINNVLRFFTKRRGFYLEGSDYVKRGVYNWWRKLCGATGGGVGVEAVGGVARAVTWSKEHYSRGINNR